MTVLRRRLPERTARRILILAAGISTASPMMPRSRAAVACHALHAGGDALKSAGSKVTMNPITKIVHQLPGTSRRRK